MSKPEIGSYKGQPTLTLNPEGYPFSFGLKKARLILDHLKSIEAFVHSDGKTLESFHEEDVETLTVDDLLASNG